MEKYILGIDIGGTNFRTALIDEAFNVIDFKIKPITQLSNGDFIKNMLVSIEEYTKAYPNAVEGIGIGFPSIVSKDKKKVYSTPNIQGLDNLNIADDLQKTLNIPVYINRDVNFLLLKDIAEHDMPKDAIVLGFYIGTGFGNTVYINGKILDGKHGVAGELGHIPVLGSELMCPCGNIGCIEMNASGKRLKKIQEEFFPDTHIEDMFSKHSDSDIVNEFIDALSIPIATEINIFDPDYIIIAGGVPIMKDFPMDKLKSCIFKRTRKPYPGDDFTIIESKSEQKCGVIGAAHYIRSL